MKCFCNIPLHKVKNNKEEYGEYCIGLSKDWGLKKGLQPVIYYNPFKSDFKDSLILSYTAATTINLNDDSLNALTEIINSTFKYLKPVINEDSNINKTKDFTDEKEWRYVPEIDDLDISEVIIDKDIIANDNLINNLNNSIIKNNKYSLDFDYNDVNYIFVKEEAERRDMILFLNTLDCPKQERDVLISKINVWETIEGDL